MKIPDWWTIVGRSLVENSGSVVAGIVDRNLASGTQLDPSVEELFIEAALVSTVAVGGWLAGDPPGVARAAGWEATEKFGMLAAHNDAPLNEVVKRCLRWRDSTLDYIDRHATEHHIDSQLRASAIARLQRSADVTIIRVCEAFESERRRTHDLLVSQQRLLAHRASSDELTGLANRSRLSEELGRLIDQHRAATVLFIDLDNFKYVNDTYGHAAGDLLLQGVAQRLVQRCRVSDVVGRIGGDEFVIITQLDKLAATRFADRLNDHLRETFVLPGPDQVQVRVTASIGIAVADRATAADTLRKADIAMYESKRAGRARSTMFEPMMLHTSALRHRQEQQLRAAIDSPGDLYYLYQPIFDLSSMAMTGVEALMRWRHPDLGTIQPDLFIPILEETGLIVPAGAEMLPSACRAASEWSIGGRQPTLAINLSARQLEADQIVSSIRDALRTSGLAPRRLVIEVTESMLMKDPDLARNRLHAIRDLGCQLAIDDFGTGYSSLSHLLDFDIDILKIDRSFIKRMIGSDAGTTIVRTIINLGHELGLTVVGEGIETQQQLEQLRLLGCDRGQGYFYSKPLPVEKVTHSDVNRLALRTGSRTS